MFIRKLVATAIMAIAATAIATATAQGQAGVAAGPSFTSVSGPVAYTTTLAADHSSATVTLAAGTFEMTPGVVTVRAADGTVAGSIPTTLRMQTGQSFEVTPAVDRSGTVLTLTPTAGPASGASTSPEAVALQSIGNAGTIAAGIAIGCFIGIVIGIWFFGFGAVIGCAIGAVIGGFIGAGV
ncbi:hypothetical protein ACFXNW_08130 [Nocardia sp. NPDC059180]|uniref:hypothetical protein n=1 Tax=Nocardia sp. NPDC059180 TaxID=3346761 RepID=UPI0036765065